MTDLRALLAHIDRVLAECDASRLPPLDSNPPSTLTRNYGGPVCGPVTHVPVRVVPVSDAATATPASSGSP